MKLHNNSLAASAATLAFCLASPLPAAAEVTEAQIAAATYPADHEAIAKSYEADAVTAEAKAKEHETMGRKYRSIGGPKSTANSSPMVRHCQRLVKSYTDAATTPGVWKGSIVSTTTGQTSSVVALTGLDGHSVWMTTDGRVWGGQVPMSGDRFDATLGGHMYDGVHFPDGTNHGTTSMMVDHHSATVTNGRYAGNGDAGTFNMSLSPMWDRPASIGTVAGVYTRSTSNGYTMTMTMSANGQLTASDSRGCLINGMVSVPDATHNMYRINATVTSCGSLDGTYSGMGALLDASAMQDWMTAMHPLEQGGHSHGGSMMGGSPMMGRNTVPTGQQNLFMFSMVNDRNAIMDALAR